MDEHATYMETMAGLHVIWIFMLKLNDDKTELIVYHQWNYQPPGRHCHQHCDSPIAPSMEPPRNLGVLFDSTYCLNDHVNKICQNINYQLYSIGKIRKYLDKPTTEKNDKFGSDSPLGLFQQPSVWYQWILSVSAITLPE